MNNKNNKHVIGGFAGYNLNMPQNIDICHITEHNKEGIQRIDCDETIYYLGSNNMARYFVTE